MPVELVDGEYQTVLGLPPEEGGYANDPVLGLVKNLGIENGTLLSALEIYVGILAATILFIATNAGVIGASRITYAMAGYRQLPEVFRRLHPTFKTPWLALTVFAGLLSILVLLPGQVDFLVDDVLVRRDALVHRRPRRRDPASPRRRRDEELLFRARPNLRLARRRLAPVRDPRRPWRRASAGSSIVVLYPSTRYAGIAWLVIGFVVYVFYRRRVLRLSLTETVRAPVQLGPAVALEYRNILVPVVTGAEGREAVDLAARLSAERGATIVALRVIVVPLDQPLDVELPDAEELADQPPRRGACCCRALRRADGRARRARAQRRACDRRGGRATAVRGDRARRPARPSASRSSARPSTTSSSTPPAV